MAGIRGKEPGYTFYFQKCNQSVEKCNHGKHTRKTTDATGSLAGLPAMWSKHTTQPYYPDAWQRDTGPCMSAMSDSLCVNLTRQRAGRVAA